MTYEEFVLSKVKRKDVKNYELVLEAVLQTDVSPSTYLIDKIDSKAVSRGLIAIFGKPSDKSVATSFNTYFMKQYRKTILGVEVDTLKTCNTCKKELPLDSFYTAGHSRNGKRLYRAHCRQCIATNEATKKYEIVLKILGYYSCKVCGYDRCKAALDFHHLDPDKKEYKISDLRHSEKHILMEELLKCIIVCANCHREIHQGMHSELLQKEKVQALMT